MEKLILYPGQVFVTQEPIEVHSNVGTCVEVVLHDPVRHITGVSIFVQPYPDAENSLLSARYGCHSLPLVLEKMCKLGADPQRVLARVIGGSAVGPADFRSVSAGKKNIDFALAWLRQARIPIVSSELGGLRARKVALSSALFSIKQTFHSDLCELESSFGEFRPAGKRTRVVIVAHSPTARATIVRILKQHELIDVVGAAGDAFEAREILVEHQPDLVIIVDDLPKVSALQLLQRLMKYFPMPVIMMTGTSDNEKANIEALECGAVDSIESPESLSELDLTDYTLYLQSMVLSAARIGDRVQNSRWSRFFPSSSNSQALEAALGGADVLLCAGDTGSHFELASLLGALPKHGPAVLLGLDSLPRAHIDKLTSQGQFNLIEAQHLQTLSPGCAYFPPRGYGLELLSVDGSKKASLVKLSAGWRGQSSRELLFESALRSVHSATRSAALLLSGLSLAGVDTFVRLRDAGVATLAVDPASSRVPILPSSAVAVGAVDVTIELDQEPAPEASKVS